MAKRQLGQSAIYTAPFILGGNVFGWTIDEKQSFEVLDVFAASECSMIDTADVYSRWAEGNCGGESETIIGKWMKARGNRQQMIIATKAGGDMGLGKKCLKKEYIIRAAEASLQRLQTDHIDLYQSHWDDETTPVEETLAAYDELIKEGKVRFIGASNFTPARLKASIDASAHGLPRYNSFQPRYNLFDRQDFESNYQQYCIDNRIGVICYYGLASGFLTGKYRTQDDLDKSKRGAGIKKYMTDRGFRIIDALDAVAQKCNATPAAIALAWLMVQPGITAPISSATSSEQLEDLLQAVSIQLDEASIRILNEASRYEE